MKYRLMVQYPMPCGAPGMPGSDSSRVGEVYRLLEEELGATRSPTGSKEAQPTQVPPNQQAAPNVMWGFLP